MVKWKKCFSLKQYLHCSLVIAPTLYQVFLVLYILWEQGGLHYGVKLVAVNSAIVPVTRVEWIFLF